MCYNSLLILKDFVDENIVLKLKKYFISLTPNNRDIITVTKVANALEVSNEMAVQLILKCENAGILKRHFGIRCPNCGMLIKEMQSPSIKNININVCYSCDEEINISENDIVVLFKLIKIEIPFDSGQQGGQRVREQTSSIVAQEDSFNAFQAMCISIDKHLQEKRIDKYEERLAKEKKEIIHKKAVEIVNRNRRINIITIFICMVIALIIIYIVYKKFGFDKLSLFVSFVAFIMPFGSNFIIKEMFLTDIMRVEERLLIKENQ